jgi:hypothetical protein
VLACSDGLRPATVTRVDEPQKHPCPCCGYLTLDEPGLYHICAICGWEDDISQLRFATLSGGANRPSLSEAQGNYAKHGWSDERAAPHVRSARSDEKRDAGWRPLTADDIEVAARGVDQGRTYPPTVAELYYWRPEYFRRARPAPG